MLANIYQNVAFFVLSLVLPGDKYALIPLYLRTTQFCGVIDSKRLLNGNFRMLMDKKWLKSNKKLI